MMNLKFRPGDEVDIIDAPSWPTAPKGRIDYSPEYARSLVEQECAWQEWHRPMMGAKGPLIVYWVWFDQPAFDCGQDGPYLGSEIEEEYLRHTIQRH